MAHRIFAADRPANIDSRLKDKDQADLVNSFKNLSVEPDALPLRPGWGTLGTSVKLRSNYFPIVKLPRKPLYEYDIIINPEPKDKRIKKRIFTLLEDIQEYAQYKNQVAHDSSGKMISASLLPRPLAINVQLYDEDEAGPREDSQTYTLDIAIIRELELGSFTR